MDGCLRLVGKEKGKGCFGAMITVKPKRECGLCPSLLSTLHKDKNKKCHKDPKKHLVPTLGKGCTKI